MQILSGSTGSVLPMRGSCRDLESGRLGARGAVLGVLRRFPVGGLGASDRLRSAKDILSPSMARLRTGGDLVGGELGVAGSDYRCRTCRLACSSEDLGMGPEQRRYQCPNWALVRPEVSISNTNISKPTIHSCPLVSLHTPDPTQRPTGGVSGTEGCGSGPRRARGCERVGAPAARGSGAAAAGSACCGGRGAEDARGGGPARARAVGAASPERGGRRRLAGLDGAGGRG